MTTPQSLTPIGKLATCYPEKFGIPRQAGLVKGAWAKLTLPNDTRHREAVVGLESFSHLWLIALFHKNINREWKPRVRPPRLGGNRSVGVFASRSPFRPNPIGLSVGEYRGMEVIGDQLELHFGATDLLDGTPIIDIKPYIAEVDAVPHANQGWLSEWPKLKVKWERTALKQLETTFAHLTHLKELIETSLCQDPRPAYHRGKKNNKTYGVNLDGANVHFKVENQTVTVLELEKA